MKTPKRKKKKKKKERRSLRLTAARDQRVKEGKGEQRLLEFPKVELEHTRDRVDVKPARIGDEVQWLI